MATEPLGRTGATAEKIPWRGEALLARWLLWNKETLREGVVDYLRRFSLSPV
eukprot:COSAG02_NODE_31554_length_531_cov_1.236111_1_plen_52_part_00